MRTRFGTGLLVACALLAPGPARSADEVVLRVGSRTLTRNELQTRLSRFGAAGFMALGGSPRERLHTYLQHYVVPELLLDEAAHSAKLEQDAELRPLRDQLLAATLERRIAQDVDAEIDDEQVTAYFEQHRSEFEQPAALLIWRILVDSRERALEIAKQAEGAGGPVRWRELCREHSLDEATKLRGGTLGFVRADGSTDVPQLRVDPALFQAASAVADGALVSTPVPQGAHFAVVWRRGHRDATVAQLSEFAASIRAALVREGTRDRLTQLLQQLRTSSVNDRAPQWIERVRYELPAFTPTDAFPLPSAASAHAPNPGERGLR